VNADGYGSIQLAAGYFDNGWCVIVYGNGSLTRMLTTRLI
jgi:hypothetical protein